MKHALYLFSVWVHILAATVWIGGMLFLVLVIVPWLRRGGRADPALFLRETGERFRNVGWTCFGLLLVTGTFTFGSAASVCRTSFVPNGCSPRSARPSSSSWVHSSSFSW